MKTNQLIRKIFNNLKNKANLLMLITTFFSSANLNSSTSSNLDHEVENKLRNFIVKFFDKNIEPNKPFEAWLKDLKELLQGTPNFKLYCTAISDIEKSRNVLDAGKNFEKFKSLIPETLKKFFQERYSKAIVLRSLTERLKKRAK